MKTANEFGLYDMSGNVVEWCWDWYGYVSYSGNAQTDPMGAATGSYQVNRDGSWDDVAGYCDVARAYQRSPGYRSSNLGFRVVRP